MKPRKNGYLKTVQYGLLLAKTDRNLDEDLGCVTFGMAKPELNNNATLAGGISTRTSALVLDGPSALALYRDRDDLRASLKPYDDSVDFAIKIDKDSEDFWLSDEDLAATLSGASIFGSLAMTEDEERIAAQEEGLPQLTRASMTRMRDAATRSRDLKKISYESLGMRPPAEDSPLYLLVPKTERRRVVRHVRQRLCGTAMPAHSFMRLGDQVYVPTPELTFLLMAHYLDLCELVMLGMELCGHYRLVAAPTQRVLSSNRTLYGQAPLTNPQRIFALLEGAQGMTGLPLAKRALGYVAAGSTSPMETALYLLLCLPKKLGGYGLPIPQLNARKRVTARAGSLVLSKTLVPDLFWPSKRLDLEYDSEEFHASPDALQKGARRALALRAMGVEVVSVTKDVVYDEDAFDALARIVAKTVGVRVRKQTQSADLQRGHLRGVVLFGEQ